MSKIETKYGRTSCLLDVPDKIRWEVMTVLCPFNGHDCPADHLYHIGILTKAACPLCNKRNEPIWTNITCVSVELSIEIQNHQDIGK